MACRTITAGAGRSRLEFQFFSQQLIRRMETGGTVKRIDGQTIDRRRLPTPAGKGPALVSGGFAKLTNNAFKVVVGTEVNYDLTGFLFLQPDINLRRQGLAQLVLQ